MEKPESLHNEPRLYQDVAAEVSGLLALRYDTDLEVPDPGYIKEAVKLLDELKDDTPQESDVTKVLQALSRNWRVNSMKLPRETVKRTAISRDSTTYASFFNAKSYYIPGKRVVGRRGKDAVVILADDKVSRDDLEVCIDIERRLHNHACLESQMRLSERQSEVISLLHLPMEDITNNTQYTEAMVHQHIWHASRRLKLPNVLSIAKEAVELGYINADKIPPRRTRKLTPRQKDFVANNHMLLSTEIAARTGETASGVEGQWKVIYKKMDAQTRYQVILFGLRDGIIRM